MGRNKSYVTICDKATINLVIKSVVDDSWISLAQIWKICVSSSWWTFARNFRLFLISIQFNFHDYCKNDFLVSTWDALKCLSMNSALTLLVKLSLRNPHFLESIERCQNRSSHPGWVESFLRCCNLKGHRMVISYFFL